MNCFFVGVVGRSANTVGQERQEKPQPRRKRAIDGVETASKKPKAAKAVAKSKR